MSNRLSETQIQDGLQNLAGWAVVAGRLEKTYSFETYADGVGFAVRVALQAEKADHHPDSLEIQWCMVKVAFVTHSADGITQLDLDAAAKVDSLK